MIRRTLFALAACMAVFSLPARGIDKDWNRVGDGFWSDNINWSPNGVPGTGDDVFLGRNPSTAGFLTTLNVSDTVNTLTMSGASRFTTGAFQLQVNGGPTTVDGLGTALFLEPRTTSDFDSLDAEGVVIRNGGRVAVSGGVLELESGLLDVGSTGGGDLGGFGTIELVETGVAGAGVLRNNGRLYVGRSIFDPLSVTLTITNFDTAGGLSGTGTVDLDGTTGNGIVDVDDGTGLGSGNLTLLVQAQISDAFDGVMQIGLGDTVDMVNANNPWTLGGGGTIEMNGAGGVATLRGQSLTLNSGSVLNANSGTARIDSNLSSSGGELYVAPNATLSLAGTNQLAPGVLRLNAASSTLEVTGNTSFVGGGQDLDWDGQGGGATTRVSGNGALVINVDNIDLNQDLYDGRLELEDNSSLSVTVADGRWDLTAVANLRKTTPGTATIHGSAITSSADIQVSAGELQINPDIVFGAAPQIDVSQGAQLTLNGLTGFTDSHLTIDGVAQLNGLVNWNSGNTISGSGRIVNEGHARFNADTTIEVAVFDWDQGTTQVAPGVTTTFDVDRIDTNNDTFNNNTIDVNSGTLSVQVADGQWDLGANGRLRLNQPTAQAPIVSGSRINVQSGGEIRVDASESTISAPLTLQTGGDLTIVAPGLVNLDGPTTFAGGDVTAQIGGVTVVQDGNLTVTGNSTVSVTTYDWDEGDTTVESNGVLNLNVTNIDRSAGQRYDRTLRLNSGTTNVDVAGNVWTMDGNLVLNNSNNDSPRLDGDAVFVGDGVGVADARIRVLGSGVSTIDASTSYRSDADTNVASGAVLEHTSTVHLLGGGTFSGDGTLAFRSNVNVTGATTLGLTGGKVDFSPSSDATGNLIQVDAPLTVEVDTFSTFGGSPTTGVHTMEIDGVSGGTLHTQVASGGWEIGPEGVVRLVSDGSPRTLLTGDTTRVRGVVEVEGAVGVAARQNIEGTVQLSTSGTRFNMSGGTIGNPDRMNGGQIQGSGRLTSSGVLVGHGLINVDIDGSGSFRADDGNLTISQDLVRVGSVGTASPTGNLNVTIPWSTTAGPLELNGGSVFGASVANDGSSISGNGTILSRVVNTAPISAVGGLLRLMDDANEFRDGGQLNAISANLEVGGLAGSLRGQLHVGAGREWHYSDTAPIVFEDTVITTSGGTLRSAGNVDWNDVDVTVEGASPSTLRGPSRWHLNSGSIDLQQDLRLQPVDGTRVGGGVAFTGTGALQNVAGAFLDLDGADIGVTLINAGSLGIADTSGGRADARDFLQTATGEFQVDLNGTLLTQFDRLIVSGTAQLAGGFDVSLGGSYVPSEGDAFPILSATGGVLGTFDTVNVPTLAGDLAFDLTYASNQVLLSVISTASPGDVNGDGVIGGDDVDGLVAGIVSGSSDPAFDLTGDGFVDAADLDAWLVVAGAANLPGGGAYLYGDATLDGFVDVGDFNAWNTTKFTSTPAWTQGDFNADGVVDVGDFNIWNTNKFSASDAAAVPEPATWAVPLLCLAWWVRRRCV